MYNETNFVIVHFMMGDLYAQSSLLGCTNIDITLFCSTPAYYSQTNTSHQDMISCDIMGHCSVSYGLCCDYLGSMFSFPVYKLEAECMCVGCGNFQGHWVTAAYRCTAKQKGGFYRDLCDVSFTSLPCSTRSQHLLIMWPTAQPKTAVIRKLVA